MFCNILIVAGEASGDLHAAGFISSIRRLLPDVHIHGIGGQKMEAAGLDCLFPSSELAVVGLIEVFSHLRPIIGAYRKVVRWLEDKRPDLCVLVDYPEFNLLIARKAKAFGIPVFYYITPQVWAWRQGRVKKLRRYTDAMAVILPFEEPFFRSHGVNATFVGHPLLDVVHAPCSREEFCANHGLLPDRRIVGLFPGSRRGEIARILPHMLDAARRIRRDVPVAQFVIPLAPGLAGDVKRLVREQVVSSGLTGIEVVEDQAYGAMSASDAVLLASGTVTLEAAILGVPMVVTYKVSPLSHMVGQYLIKVPFISLVNLVAARQIVPEILQEAVNGRTLAGELLPLLTDESRRRRMLDGLAEVRRRLGSPGAASRAASLAMEIMGYISGKD